MRNRTLGIAIILVSVVSMVISGCSVLQQSGGSGGGESYFPHAQGYTWRTTSTDGSTQIMTVEETAQIGSTSVQCFSAVYFWPSNAVSTNETYYRVDSTGVYLHGSPASPSSIGLPLFAFPLEVGKTWDVIVSGSSSTKGNVLAKENVTVPAGTFDCYKIALISMTGTIETYRSNIWLGNNAGMVKVTSSSSTVESVLSSKNF